MCARLIYWLPLIQMVLGTLHIPGPALIAPVFAAYLAVELYSLRAMSSRPVLKTA